MSRVKIKEKCFSFFFVENAQAVTDLWHTALAQFQRAHGVCAMYPKYTSKLYLFIPCNAPVISSKVCYTKQDRVLYLFFSFSLLVYLVIFASTHLVSGPGDSLTALMERLSCLWNVPRKDSLRVSRVPLPLDSPPVLLMPDP